MNSERTDQLQLSVFGQLESNKKWPRVGHNTGACLLSSLCLLTAALLMNLGTSSIPLKPNEAVGRHSVAMTVLHYATSLPGPIHFPAVQTNFSRREKQWWSESQKLAANTAGNQFSPCSVSGRLRRLWKFQSSSAEDYYWELQPSTVLSSRENEIHFKRAWRR